MLRGHEPTEKGSRPPSSFLEGVWSHLLCHLHTLGNFFRNRVWGQDPWPLRKKDLCGLPPWEKKAEKESHRAPAIPLTPASLRASLSHSKDADSHKKSGLLATGKITGLDSCWAPSTTAAIWLTITDKCRPWFTGQLGSGSGPRALPLPPQTPQWARAWERAIAGHQ